MRAPPGAALGHARAREVLAWFWGAVEALPHEQRARLMQFASGSSRLPVGGFRAHTLGVGDEAEAPALSSSGGFDALRPPFTITLQPTAEAGKCAPLPSAHTCFNELVLPAYATRELLVEKVFAVTVFDIGGFGMA